jgi:pSer/pThr/pTyr-binding forkhead associated (FHA) protein
VPVFLTDLKTVDLFLEIIDGPLQGTRTPLRDGLTLGRKGCDLNIEDSKVSSRHARLEERPDGSFWLIDDDSANGIRVDGKRTPELRLKAGASFRLGRTRFQVLGAGEMASEGLQTKVKNVFKKAKGGKKWREVIVHLSERVIRESELKKIPTDALLPFEHALKLSFKRGIQSGTDWILSYGPREVGASSVDLPLFEPGLPAKCFRLLPRDNEIVIRIEEAAFGKILLNGKRFETAFVRPGDVLEIGNTQIEIEFET